MPCLWEVASVNGFENSLEWIANNIFNEVAILIGIIVIVGLLLQRKRFEEILSGAMTAVGPGVHLLRADPDYVARAHAAGKEVHVWTANSAADMDFVVGLGVDAVITDHPAELLTRLGREPAV